jgi:hypothetical protein
MANNDDREPGRRKDGKPFAPKNTRQDGSYEVGKNRPPESGRFSANDGRARGRRAKGTKNLATDWQEELASKIVIKEGGLRCKVTKQRAVVKSTIDRALKHSDRASEIAMRHAGAPPSSVDRLNLSDDQIIESWLAHRFGVAQEQISDDHHQSSLESSSDDDS